MFAPTVSLVVAVTGIRSLPAFGKARAPRTPTALYPRWREYSTAVPQYISGRTSYLQVRLEFLRYPQFIRALCNGHQFGPPRTVTHASA